MINTDVAICLVTLVMCVYGAWILDYFPKIKASILEFIRELKRGR